MAPFTFSGLSNEDKRQCGRLTRNSCDLHWDEGDHPFETRHEIASIISQKESSFVTKGLEKSIVLSQFLNTKVTNVEEFGCPRIATIVCVTTRSTLHQDENSGTLVKACRIATWLHRREYTNI